MSMLGLDIAYLYTNFGHSTLSHSRDMVGVHRHFNCSRDLTTPLLEMICHPLVSTCYDKAVY